MTKTNTTISSIRAWEGLDSRGRPTVGCRVDLAGGAYGRALAPAGASTGGYEARELRDGGERYGGYGVRTAVAHVTNTIGPNLLGFDCEEQSAIDGAMEALDGSPGLGELGANAVLAVSLASTLALADARREPLWRVLSNDSRPLLPMPMVNIVSGGAHAAGALDIQDVLAVPIGASSFAQAMEWVSRVRAATARELTDLGASPALVADEGGLAAALGSNEKALSLVTAGIARSGLDPGTDVSLAVDCAANQMANKDGYYLATERSVLSSAEWIDRVDGWCDSFPLVSVEDVLHEDDWPGWVEFTSRRGSRVQILGDDFFATNSARLERGITERAANAVLVKPNQAGTVTRAKRTMHIAQRSGYATVVSARSGDTEDSWLADFAVGWAAGQIKVGSTMRSERTAKWNRLLEIEATAGEAARFAGRSAFAALRE